MRFSFALVTIFAFLSALLPAADKVIGGPYAVNVTGRSATIMWVVETGEVTLSPEGDGPSKTVPALRTKFVGFTGLKPGMSYKYTVPDLPGIQGRFRTPPAARAAFQFVVFGDTRTRHEMHQKVADAVVKVEPDFVVHTGDLVSDGQDTSMWPIFFGIENELLRKSILFPVLGNHERNSRHFYEFFGVTTPYYSFNWGSAHFTLLNSDYGNAAASRQARDAFWSEQVKWLEDDLAAAQKADFRFVAMHHPPFTAVKSRQTGENRVSALVPLFEKYGVTAVFNGHDHNYQHHRKNGVAYIVTGGGGAPLYPVDGPIEGITQKVESTENFVKVKVDGDRALLEAIALDGRTLDRIEFGPPKQP